MPPCICLQAAQQPARSRQRLLLVAAYSVSIYSNLVRTTKPFKELQNSTYELVYPERGYRMIGEKVSASFPSWQYFWSQIHDRNHQLYSYPAQEAAHRAATRARAWSILVS